MPEDAPILQSVDLGVDVKAEDEGDAAMKFRGNFYLRGCPSADEEPRSGLSTNFQKAPEGTQIDTTSVWVVMPPYARSKSARR